MQAMLRSACAPSSWMKSCNACSTFSLLIVLTQYTKKRLHYTLNTLHQTLHNTLTIRGGQKYRYGNISRYIAAQYNIDFSTPNIDISLKSDSAVRRVYFCSRESGWGLCKMDGKLTTPPQFKVDVWKHFGFKVKRDSKNNELDKENITAWKFHGN